MKKKMIFSVVCIFMFTADIIGQTNQYAKASSVTDEISKVPGSALQVVRNIEIKEDSKTEDILISIDKKTNQFSLYIESIIKKGKLTIEIYDSLGGKQGNFTIQTQLNGKKREEVNGQFEKSWKNLPIGKWKVKIIPSSATANVRIITSLID